MKIVVTGGAGFIGSHVADRLVEEGHEVYIIDSLVTGQMEWINPGARFENIDICDDKIFEVITKIKPDVVFHYAALIDIRISRDNPVYDAEKNIIGSLKLLEAARKNSVKRFVFASTAGVYGEKESLPVKEEMLPDPLMPYAIGKLSVEHYVRQFYCRKGLNCAVFRFGNVYGPRQGVAGEAGVVGIFIDKIMKEEEITVFGSGNQTRDFIYVSDVVEFNARVLENKTTGLFNIGTGVESSINDLHRIMGEVAGKKVRVEYREKVEGELDRSALDNSKAVKALGYQPLIGLEQGIQKTLQFYKSREFSGK